MTAGVELSSRSHRALHQINFHRFTAMTEDEIYRASTQYRLWSFTPEMLRTMRSTTNSLAADGVRTAIHSLNLSKAQADSDHDASGGNGSNAARTVDCLTVEEDQKLVGFYCIKTMEFADFCEFPTNVKVHIPSTRGGGDVDSL